MSNTFLLKDVSGNDIIVSLFLFFSRCCFHSHHYNIDFTARHPSKIGIPHLLYGALPLAELDRWISYLKFVGCGWNCEPSCLMNLWPQTACTRIIWTVRANLIGFSISIPWTIHQLYCWCAVRATPSPLVLHVELAQERDPDFWFPWFVYPLLSQHSVYAAKFMRQMNEIVILFSWQNCLEEELNLGRIMCFPVIVSTGAFSLISISHQNFLACDQPGNFPLIQPQCWQLATCQCCS